MGVPPLADLMKMPWEISHDGASAECMVHQAHLLDITQTLNAYDIEPEMRENPDATLFTLRLPVQAFKQLRIFPQSLAQQQDNLQDHVRDLSQNRQTPQEHALHEIKQHAKYRWEGQAATMAPAIHTHAYPFHQLTGEIVENRHGQFMRYLYPDANVHPQQGAFPQQPHEALINGAAELRAAGIPHDLYASGSKGQVLAIPMGYAPYIDKCIQHEQEKATTAQPHMAKHIQSRLAPDYQNPLFPYAAEIAVVPPKKLFGKPDMAATYMENFTAAKAALSQFRTERNQPLAYGKDFSLSLSGSGITVHLSEGAYHALAPRGPAHAPQQSPHSVAGNRPPPQPPTQGNALATPPVDPPSPVQPHIRWGGPATGGTDTPWTARAPSPDNPSKGNVR